MGEFEELLGDLGVEQWVRSRFVSKLREFQKTERPNVEVFVREFSAELFADFTKVAKKTVEEVIDKASVLLDPKGEDK